MSDKPLNPFLYERLRKAFGRVDVSDRGAGVRGHFTPYGNRSKFYGVVGEYYRVNCPFCNDKRQRLWINHRWGVGIPESNPRDRFWWAAHCFNEDCLSNHDNLAALRTLVLKSLPNELRHVPTIYPGSFDDEPISVVEPGECVLVNQLPPDHPGRLYLTNRGFDVDNLAQQYGVRFCHQADKRYRLAQDRIIAPIWHDHELVGWQARYVGEANGDCIPKYYTAPGSRVSRRLYNIESASKQPFVIICEGVFDVWAVGEAAVALFKKTMSMMQADLICAHFDYAVILLDGDASSESLNIAEQLRRRISVVNVRLPDGQDPASMDRQELFLAIERESRAVGIDLLALPSRNSRCGD